MEYFFAADFDNTIGDTFAQALSGISVNEAYALACAEIFGKVRGPRLYKNVGGLRNRAPGALIEAMLLATTPRERIVHVQAAKDFLRDRGSDLLGHVPAGKGVPLIWNEKNPFPVITELLVRMKMDILMPQIGSLDEDGEPWPRPCPGFLRFWEDLCDFNVRNEGMDVQIHFGILSSGHDVFIKHCFALWGIQPPHHMVTDDLLRSAKCDDLAPEERTKPHPKTLMLLCEQWYLMEAVLYGGDCQEKDGQLAERADIPFIWFNWKRSPSRPFRTYMVEITDWQQLRPLFSVRSASMMQDHRPFREIIETVF